jgi:hypothetical protein
VRKIARFFALCRHSSVKDRHHFAASGESMPHRDEDQLKRSQRSWVTIQSDDRVKPIV